MSKLTLQRIPFTVDADNRLRTLKARTGITPNILCRIGFCLSLEEPGIPKSIPEKTEMGREINRFTLLGEYDLGYTHLLAAWIQENDPNSFQRELNDYFVAHMNRGVEILNARIKGLTDLSKLT
jgi:DNA sulfur modification protein DndE